MLVMNHEKLLELLFVLFATLLLLLLANKSAESVHALPLKLQMATP